MVIGFCKSKIFLSIMKKSNLINMNVLLLNLDVQVNIIEKIFGEVDINLGKSTHDSFVGLQIYDDKL